MNIKRHGKFIQPMMQQEISRGGDANPRDARRQVFYFSILLQTMHENENFWIGARRTRHEILALPLTQGIEACLSSGLSLTLKH